MQDVNGQHAHAWLSAVCKCTAPSRGLVVRWKSMVGAVQANGAQHHVDARNEAALLSVHRADGR